MADLKCCPICGRSKTDEDIRGAERDWEPTLYDPDSGGDPLYIHCECGLVFSTGTYDCSEFVEAWNTRKPEETVVAELEKEKVHQTFCDKEVGFNKGIRKAISIVRGKE